MKKRTALIGVLASFLPIGQPLFIGTGVALTSTAVMLSVPEKAQAESEDGLTDDSSKMYEIYRSIEDFDFTFTRRNIILLLIPVMIFAKFFEKGVALLDKYIREKVVKK